MKKSLLFLCLTVLLAACSSKPDTGVRHIVCFKFKSDATEAQVDAFIDGFKNLKNEIEEIKAFEWGLNNSTEGFDQGMTHIFQVTFDDIAGRDAYLPHPAHQAFVEKHLSIVEEGIVVDYSIE
ncbi:MAG: Dabb family protein [Cytophagia bacterium]|nr:Dabb family protein [Cytophagia bacterium]